MCPSVPNPLLGPAQAGAFVQSYWQRQPAVIHAALPRSACRTPGLQTVLRLAQEDIVESRLITKSGHRWQVEHGPFERTGLPGLDCANWTLLVQGVDLHLEAARGLLDRFRFLPDARIDDLMISIAGSGGGVGPHTDEYDVFLLQMRGRRRWHLAPPADYPWQSEQELKLIDGFQPARSHLLGPGDMLYLPAGWAHDGIAVDACMTASIGFRAPARHEMASAFLQEQADLVGQAIHDPRYRDSTTTAAQHRRRMDHPAQVPADMMQTLVDWLVLPAPSRGERERFAGRYLSEPKPQTWFTRPSRRHGLQTLRRRGIRLDRRTRMLWFNRRIYINGEDSAPRARDALPLLKQLADQRQLSARQTGQLLDNDDTNELILSWYESGWLHPAKG